MPKQLTNNNTESTPRQVQPDDLTLDVCILISGSGISDDITTNRYGRDCFDLMRRMIANDKYHLALDSRSKIRVQYDTKLSPDTYGHSFVRQMATMGKIDIIPWQDINRGLRIKLSTKGFTRDSEDYKFVVVASCTCSKKLVSHESHFFNIQRILGKIGIVILWPSNA